MDRRRIILAVFFVALAVAALDVYSNGVEILDDFGRLLSVRFGPPHPGQTRWDAPVRMTLTEARPAGGAETLVLDNTQGYVEITGDDVDEIRVELELYAFTNGDPEEARRILEAYDIVLLPGRTTVQLSARQPEEPVPFDGIHHAVWRIVVPREMAVEVRTTPAVVNIAGVRGGIRAEGVGAQLFLQPAGAAAIDVSLALGGLLDIALPEEAANHSLHAVLNPGSLFVDAPGFESIRAGARETLTGAIGEGAHPLRIELIDSSGFVRIGK